MSAQHPALTVERDMLDTINLKTITAQDLAALGIGEVAYLRPVEIQGEIVFAIMAADGRQIGLAPDYQSAVGAMHQHDLELATTH